MFTWLWSSESAPAPAAQPGVGIMPTIPLNATFTPRNLTPNFVENTPRRESHVRKMVEREMSHRRNQPASQAYSLHPIAEEAAERRALAAPPPRSLRPQNERLVEEVFAKLSQGGESFTYSQLNGNFGGWNYAHLDFNEIDRDGDGVATAQDWRLHVESVNGKLWNSASEVLHPMP